MSIFLITLVYLVIDAYSIMIYLYLLATLSLLTICVEASPVSNIEVKNQKILVFSKTEGYYHTAIPSGRAAIQKLGAENGFDVDLTNDSSSFTHDSLNQYAAVVWLCTTNNVLNNEQQQAFMSYIRSGHGFVGVHSAADTEYYWPWYNSLLGAHLSSHPTRLQTAILNVVDRKHISTRHLPEKWILYDEWYNYNRTLWGDVHVLLAIDESSYIGGENGKFHPMSWYRNFDGGRSFFTEMSHTNETYNDPFYLQHLLGGILYAMGNSGHRSTWISSFSFHLLAVLPFLVSSRFDLN